MSTLLIETEKATLKYSPLSEKELQEIGSEVTEVFGKLATFLGFSNSEVHHIRADNETDIERAVFVMLVKWQQKQSSRTNYREVLAEALTKCKRRDMGEKVLTGK